MTKTQSNPAFWYLYLIVLTILSTSGSGEKDHFFNDLQIQLEKYNNDFYTENTFLVTDRFVYRPGDDLWFKGYVNSCSDLSGISKSEDYFIRLLNSNGEEIVFRRYPLLNNEVFGQINIPRSSIPGKYWLIAYTGWMKNRFPQEAFRKEILISKYYEKRFRTEIMYNKLAYSAGDTMDALIRILDANGKPVTETAFDYSIGNFNKTEIKGAGRTDIKGKAKIINIIPANNEILTLTIELKSHKNPGDYSLLIPVTSNINKVTFYPEGGNVVAGIINSVALKVTDKNGLPQIITGFIKNKKGDVFTTVTTGVTGIGKFSYTPTYDTCYLEINHPDGINDRFPLPAASKEGIVLRLIHQKADSALFSISSTDDVPLKTYWVVTKNRKIIWKEAVDFTGYDTVIIPLEKLPEGLLQVTVFNEERIPVAERLLQNIHKKETLAVKLGQPIFQSRQRVNLIVENNGIFNTMLTISVSLNNLSKIYESNAFNGRYSVSDDHVPTPSEIMQMNDIDLMTTDYRIINWTEVLSHDQKQIYSPHNGLSGKVLDKKDIPSVNAKVRITHFPNFRFYETQTDENGQFNISFGSEIIDYKFLNIDAYDASGKTSLNTVIDYEYAREISKEIVENSNEKTIQKISDLIKYGEPDLVYVLRYGPGKFKKSAPDSRKKYIPQQYANYTDIMDIIQDIKPYWLSNNKIYFIDKEKSKSDTFLMEEAIIVVNGSLKGSNIAALQNIIPSDITNINISNSPYDIHKYTPLNFRNVIEITTIQGLYKYRQPGIQFGTNVFNSGREFYSPDYTVESNYAPDSRRTLYWNPKLQVTQGGSLVITFYTSDIKGIFSGQLTGFDKDGNYLAREFMFRVE